MKIMGHKEVDVSDQEYEYYESLVAFYTKDGFNGGSYFNDLFQTDENGIINIIIPKKSIPWSIVFFIQNIMINQHLSMHVKTLDAFDKRICAIERKIGEK